MASTRRPRVSRHTLGVGSFFPPNSRLPGYGRRRLPRPAGALPRRRPPARGCRHVGCADQPGRASGRGGGRPGPGDHSSPGQGPGRPSLPGHHGPREHRIGAGRSSQPWPAAGDADRHLDRGHGGRASQPGRLPILGKCVYRVTGGRFKLETTLEKPWMSSTVADESSSACAWLPRPRSSRSNGCRRRPWIFSNSTPASPAWLAEDPRRRRLLLTLELDRRCVSAPVGFALADFITRAVLAATEIELPLAFAGRAARRGIVLRVRENGAERPGLRWAGRTIRAVGRPAELAACIRDWTRIGFSPGGPGREICERWHARLDEVKRILTGGGRPLPAAPAAAPTLRFRENWPSEVRRVADALRRLPAGTGALDGVILVSKPAAARRALTVELAKILRAKGYRPRLTVLNAYKPGLSWLLEVIGPQLRKTPGLARVELAFRPFSAGPNALEMESRWAQEIFPHPTCLRPSAAGRPHASVWSGVPACWRLTGSGPGTAKTGSSSSAGSPRVGPVCRTCPAGRSWATCTRPAAACASSADGRCCSTWTSPPTARCSGAGSRSAGCRRSRRACVPAWRPPAANSAAGFLGGGPNRGGAR